MLMAIRLQEPIVLIATGKGLTSPLTVGFSIKSALPPPGAFHLAIGKLGDLQLRRQRLADARKLTGLFESIDKVLVRGKCHIRSPRQEI